MPVRTRRAPRNPAPLAAAAAAAQPDELEHVAPALIQALLNYQRTQLEARGDLDLSEIVTNGLTRSRFSFLVLRRRLMR